MDDCTSAPAPRCRRPDARVVPGDGNLLLDAVAEHLEAKNDAALCRELEVLPSLISKIRHGRSVGAQLLIRMHEVTGLSIRDLRLLMGDTRPHFEE
jgi:hypothetical protein